MNITFAKELEIYITEHGVRPFIDWLESIKDGKMRARIKERLERVRLGNMGDCKYIKEGVSELRLAFGPGYRIYFGQNGSKIILLLCGGDKTSQKKDLKNAICYWQDYLRG